jgi:hypothetical protein
MNQKPILSCYNRGKIQYYIFILKYVFPYNWEHTWCIKMKTIMTSNTKLRVRVCLNNATHAKLVKPLLMSTYLELYVHRKAH